MRTPALIFDFGNVVSFFDYLIACERLGKPVGLTAEDFRRRILDRGFADLLVRFESGQMAPEDFAAQVMTLGEVTLPYPEFVNAWQDIFRLNEPVARLIERLKSSEYPLLLGSNTNVLHYAHYRQQFAPTLDLLDRHVLSHEVGRMKPHRAFYEACALAAGLPAGSCVFIDDLEENIAGARAAGLMGVHYVDTPTLIVELQRLGVEVAEEG